MFQQLLFPTIFYLILITQCKLSNGVDDSYFTAWEYVNMEKDTSTWPGIKNLIGKDPCADNMKYCIELATIIKKRENATALRKNCEYDEMVKYSNETCRLICWIRQKKTYDVVKRTVFEAQFWTESPTVSQVRWAGPSDNGS
uniref:Uncharacterized protein n=1 Tax=Cacopsylla melanoneura TaxID=428564 RepID=A0A8D8WRD8_9HEMI